MKDANTPGLLNRSVGQAIKENDQLESRRHRRRRARELEHERERLKRRDVLGEFADAPRSLRSRETVRPKRISACGERITAHHADAGRELPGLAFPEDFFVDLEFHVAVLEQLIDCRFRVPLTWIDADLLEQKAFRRNKLPRCLHVRIKFGLAEPGVHVQLVNRDGEQGDFGRKRYDWRSERPPERIPVLPWPTID